MTTRNVDPKLNLMPRTSVTVATPYSTSRTYRASQSRKYAAAQKRANMLMAKRALRGPLRTGGFWGPSLRPKNEKKSVSLGIANYACNSTGSVTALNLVATGTDFTNRIGRKINIKSVFIRGWVFPEDNDTLQQMARVMLVWDEQPNGALAAVTDILDTVDSSSQLNLNQIVTGKPILG